MGDSIDKKSSCIAIFSSRQAAESAQQQLFGEPIYKDDILLISKETSQRDVASLMDYLNSIGVQDDMQTTYLSLLQDGQFLLAVRGDDEAVELAYERLNQDQLASPLIHFNSL